MSAEPIDVVWELDAPEDTALMSEVRRVTEALREAVGSAHRDVCVLLVDDAEIQALNAQWRDEDKATDVLSFPVDDEGPEGPPVPLGDIVISVDTCGRQAADHGWGVAQEITFLLVHSVCHLMGHDHGESTEAAEMRAEEDRLLAIVAPDQARPPTPY
jgi:probable rRNA maturation factor